MNVPAGEQLSFFPTEAEQIQIIAEAESVTNTPFAFSFAQDDIDDMLRLASNSDHTRMVVAAAFQEQKPMDDIVTLLRKEYHGGAGMKSERGEFSVWYAEDGIHLAKGRTARYVGSAQVISWEAAAERISQLMDEGKYATNVELAEAELHERTELSHKLWNIRGDLSDEAKEQNILGSLQDYRRGGFPDDTARLSEALKDPAFRRTLSADYTAFMDAYKADRNVMRFHYHKPVEIWNALQDLDLPRREYTSDMAEVPKVGMFITEDEIDATLNRGSDVEGGKGRIYTYLTGSHNSKEKADFLKNEYGQGGSSHAVSGQGWIDSSGKGIRLQKPDCADVKLNWNQVAKRIDELIRKGRYMTQEALAEHEAKKEAKMQEVAGRESIAKPATEAQEIVQQPPAFLDYNDIKQAHPDDVVLYQVGVFFEMYGEDAKIAAEALELHLTSRSIPDVGRVAMCGIPAHALAQYVEQLRESYGVTIAATQDGSAERKIYSLAATSHEPVQTVSEAEQAQPTIREQYERYKPTVMTAVTEDTPYRNACGHSDRENAVIEGNAAVRRAILGSGDLELIRLYSDVPEFRNRLHQEVIDETYPRLHELLRPLSQDDIDDALRTWNGSGESKNAVVRYMEQHGREKDTAAWLSHEYGGDENKNLFIVRAGSPETTELTWAKVQRRIAQLIKEDRFLEDWEKVSEPRDYSPEYRLLSRLHTDCEYFLGEGRRSEKHLWAGNVRTQITKMRELYDMLPDKPEWLTSEAIDSYADRMAPPYLVVAYHHFENGFDEKRDYQTLEEAEKAAQGYVDGTMESDGFAYDGAAVYDKQEQKYLRIYGDYPDEKAHAQVETHTKDSIIPAEPVLPVAKHDPLAPPYKVGDTVYLDDTAFEITEINVFDIQLRDPMLYYPIFRSESKAQFERLLQQDNRNGGITEFLPAELDITDTDLQDVLTGDGGLLAQRDKEIISRWFRNGEGNKSISHRMSETYAGTVETMTLLSGEEADFRATTVGLEIEIQDKFNTKLSFHWDEIVPVLRAMYRQERDGFYHEPVLQEPVTLEGIPAYKVGDSVVVPYPDRDIKGTIGYIGDIDVRIDTGPYSWSHETINREQFENFIRHDERNAHLFTPEVSAEKDNPRGNSEYFRYFYDYETDQVDAFMAEHPDYHKVWGSDSQGLNGGTWVVYRNESDLPAFLREYARNQRLADERTAVKDEKEPSPEITSETVATYPGDDTDEEPDLDKILDESPISVQMDGEWRTFPNAAAAEDAMYEESKAEIRRNAQNFHITDDNLGIGGAKAKFRMNMDAINLLKELEIDGRQATPEEQAVLAKYVGWGGLADAFDETKDNWKNEFAELYATLSPEEYAAARSSTLNAHYTSPTVIKAIYEAVGNMGFQTGNILDK